MSVCKETAVDREGSAGNICHVQFLRLDLAGLQVLIFEDIRRCPSYYQHVLTVEVGASGNAACSSRYLGCVQELVFNCLFEVRSIYRDAALDSHEIVGISLVVLDADDSCFAGHAFFHRVVESRLGELRSLRYAGFHTEFCKWRVFVEFRERDFLLVLVDCSFHDGIAVSTGIDNLYGDEICLVREVPALR